MLDQSGSRLHERPYGVDMGHLIPWSRSAPTNPNATDAPDHEPGCRRLGTLPADGVPSLAKLCAGRPQPARINHGNNTAL